MADSLNIYELRYGTRSEDYPFTYVELVIDSNGKGEGTLIPAARIHFDSKNKNQVDAENFGIYPARLVGVQLRNKSWLYLLRSIQESKGVN